MKNIKKLKPDKKIYMTVAAILVIIIAVAAYFISSAKKNGQAGKAVNVSLVGTNLKQDVTVEQPTVDPNRVAATVDIEFEDCAVAVGTQFMVIASVTPQESSEALQWTTSNENVFSVNKQGIVTIKGVGTAVLSATIGDVTDAVIIEGIRTIADGSSNNLPVYTDGVIVGVVDDIKPDSSGDSGGSGNSGNSGSSDGSGNKGNIGNTGGNGSSGNTGDSGDSGNAGGNGGSGNSGGSGNNGDSGNSGGSGDSGNTGGDSSNNDDSGDNTGDDDSSDTEGLKSDSIGNYLPGIGFSRYISNVYIYKDGTKDCGQIVLQPNVTIMYIKDRNTSFDNKIKEVLKLLLPDYYDVVWSNFTTANTDRTFAAGNRKVRIVVSGNGGYSQIVIYN